MINKVIAIIKKFIYTYLRKKVVMAKKKELEVSDTSELTQEVVPPTVTLDQPKLELNEVAFGLAKDKTTGRYHMVTIKYDFDSKTVGSLEVSPEANDEKLIIFDNMKIAIGKYMWR